MSRRTLCTLLLLTFPIPPSPAAEVRGVGWAGCDDLAFGEHRIVPGADRACLQLYGWELLTDALALDAPDGAPGEAVPSEARSGRVLRLELEGNLFPRSQARRPEPPFEPFRVRRDVTVDPDGGRYHELQELQWPSFLARYRLVVTPETSFDVNLTTGAVSPPFRDPEETLRGAVRWLPRFLLEEILEEAPGSIRFEGVVDREGNRLRRVSAVHRGERIALSLDEDGRLVEIGRMVSEPMFGDAWERLRYGESRSLGSLDLPESIERSVDGIGVTQRLEIRFAAWVEPDPELFERPEESPRRDGAGAPPTDPAEGFGELTEVAPDVWAAPIPGSPDYRSLVVEREDHLVLVEAPVGESEVRELLGRLAERFPGKPVRWVVATHHHFDHSAGVPAAVEQGATAITSPGNAAFFRRAVAGPRTLAGGGALRPEPELRLVAEEWTLPGGPPEIRVLAAGPTAHVEEMLFVFLPGAGLLFQGDLVRFPLEAGSPVRPQARRLLERIDELGLDVQTILGVHGEAGTIRALREAVESGSPGG